MGIMTIQEWNKIEHGVPEEGDECAVILHNGNMEVGKFQIMKSYTGKTRVGFSGNGWWIGIDAVKYYMVMTRPEEV